jgi:hypothetical protein
MGWGSARCRVRVGEGAERGGGVRCHVGRHGTGAVALGRSDSGGREQRGHSG